MPRGPANFLKELAHDAIDSGADMFVTTGNHNLGPIEIYKSPGARQPADLLWARQFFLERRAGAAAARPVRSGNRELLAEAWQHPAKATEYDLTAPLNKAYFAHAFTFQSVIAEVRFKGNELAEIVLHPVELGYGDRLTTSGIPRLVTDEAEARTIIDQVVKQTAQFGLPKLGLRFDGSRAVIATGR